jgi:hypothetical protein
MITNEEITILREALLYGQQARKRSPLLIKAIDIVDKLEAGQRNSEAEAYYHALRAWFYEDGPAPAAPGPNVSSGVIRVMHDLMVMEQAMGQEGLALATRPGRLKIESKNRLAELWADQEAGEQRSDEWYTSYGRFDTILEWLEERGYFSGLSEEEVMQVYHEWDSWFSTHGGGTPASRSGNFRARIKHKLASQ